MPEENKQTRLIADKTSQTASFTCLARAVSYYEKRPCYRSDDYVAPRLIPRFFLPVARFSVIRRVFVRLAFPDGAYEYVIARTKFIDSVVQAAVAGGFSQIVIFGAGFDSRSIRLTADISGLSLFELDAPATQSAKIGQLKKRHIPLPGNLVFVPADLAHASVEDSLLGSDFTGGQKTLFVLEGLLMYLDGEDVDKTFAAIRKLAGASSEVVFDYVFASVVRGENRLFGEAEIVERVRRAGEAWRFGIEKGKIKEFLKDNGFALIQDLEPDDLEKKYFADEQGQIVGRVNGAHSLVHAAYVLVV